MPRLEIDLHPIHYLGNKARILPHLERAMLALTPAGHAVADLFAGSGVVTRRFTQTRDTYSSDIQAYSGVLVTALCARSRPGLEDFQSELAAAKSYSAQLGDAASDLIEAEESTLQNEDEQALARIVETGAPILGEVSNSLKSIPLQDRVMLTYYGGIYFSYRQAIEIDALMRATNSLPDELQVFARAALLTTASEVVTSVGNHFAQPIRPKSSNGQMKAGFAKKVARHRSISPSEVFWTALREYLELPDSPFRATSQVGDFREALRVLPNHVSTVYADPPYTRDHYSRFYHVLETIARGDDPGVSTNQAGEVVRGLYRRERHQSPFSIRTQATPAFQQLFAEVARTGRSLILSYSPATISTPARQQSRVVLLEDLVLLAQRIFTSVELRSVGDISHSKFNLKELSGGEDTHAEKLLICSR